MKRLRAFALVGPLALAAWLAFAGVLGAAKAPDLEEQVRQIAADLRCPVCQNLSVADSPSPLAQEMRGLIREQLQQGKTRQEILAYFESKYGEWALLAPKPTGFNLLAYVVPFLAGAAGILGVLLGIRRWVRRRQAQAEAAPEVSAADRERLRQALEAQEEEEEGGPEMGKAPGPLAELGGQRATLYAAIRELEFDWKAGMISDEDYAAMRRRYEAEAVGILRRLDALSAGTPAGRGPDSRKAASAPASAVAPVPRAASADDEGDAAEDDEAAEAAAARVSRRRLWVAAGAVALVAFGVLAGALLMLSIRPRPEGGSITGGPLTGTGAEMPPAASASEPGGARRPIDAATLGRMLQAAHAALDAGRFAEAAAAYRAVLERDPRNVEALTHMGNILERSGEAELALGVYDKALAIDPRSLHTLWDKGHLLFQRADYAGALKAWQAFFEAAAPGPDRDYIEQRMADARARLTASGPVPRPASKSKAPGGPPEGS